MSTLERAIEMAARAHAGQVDKAGEPYILHPMRLMLAVRGELERIAAVLHDVVEDTDVTMDELRTEGFPDAVLNAVEALTKHRANHARRRLSGAAENPIARAVKLADVADNMNLARIARPTEADFARLREYEQVRAILSSQAKS